MTANRGFKKGDRVVVTTHEFDTTPDGTVNDAYGFGTTGVIEGFRFHGRQAIVRLDREGDARYVDWTITNIERSEEQT